MADMQSPRLALFDLRNDGSFYSPSGEQVVIFGVADLQHFLGSLDVLFEAPIGRKVLYAAADAEELVLQAPTFALPRWFGKKKIREVMTQRFPLMGWGLYESSAIRFPIHDALSVGFALAHHEHVSSQRWEVEWQQQTQDHISCTFQEKNQPMVPATRPNVMGWGANMNSNPAAAQIEIDIDERNFGFFIGEQRSAFFPVIFFELMFDQLRGRKISNVSQGNTPLVFTKEVPQRDLFVAIAVAAQQMFQTSTTPVFIRNGADWKALLNSRLTAYGFGCVTVETTVVDGHDATLFVVQSPVPAMVCGVLMGMWERCHGVRCQTTIDVGSHEVRISLSKIPVDY